MSRIITDLEHGAVVLVHDLTNPPTPGESIPQELVGAVAGTAERLGLDAASLAPAHAGWLFDLVGHVVEALSASQGGAGGAAAGSDGGSPTEGATGAQTASSAGETEVQAPGEVQEPAAEHETEAQAPSGAEAEAKAPVVEAPPPNPAIDDVIAKAQADFGGGSPAA